MINLNMASKPDTAIKSPMPAVSTNRTFWHKLKGVAIASVMLALAASNVMLLANDHFHAKAYGVMEAFISLPFVVNLGSTIFADQMLANSPTEKISTKIETATRRLIDKNKKLADEIGKTVAENKIEREKLLKSHLDDRSRLISAHDQERDKLVKSHLDDRSRLISAHDQERDKLVKTTERHRAAAVRVGARIAPRMTKNAMRNAGSVFLEAIPYAGIPVMIAVTSADIYDACETLKDLNQMNEAFGEAKEDETKVCGLHIPDAKEILDKIRRH